MRKTKYYPDCDHICIEGENISFSDNARNLFLVKLMIIAIIKRVKILTNVFKNEAQVLVDDRRLWSDSNLSKPIE